MKIHTKTGDKCICCDESTEAGVLLHKTRRQTHSLCSSCADGYLGPLLAQSIGNIKKKIWTGVSTVQCPGSYHGSRRNQCKCQIPIKTLVFDSSSPLATDVLRIAHVLENKELAFCPTRGCPNIIRIHAQDPIAHTCCSQCHTTWCRYCMVQPYHEGMSCLEYEASLASTDNGKLVAKLLKEGSLKLCPLCKAPTIKQQDSLGRDLGCNKISCSSCKTRWCWLCGETDVSYTHFNSEGKNPCAKRLWEGTAHQAAQNL